MRNWVHLDLKGVVPSREGLLRWIEWLREAGFNGIVWEYEDRIPWESWPEAFRPGFPLDEWHGIWKRCEALGFEIVPLAPTLGHLAWLLSHPAYSHWQNQ